MLTMLTCKVKAYNAYNAYKSNNQRQSLKCFGPHRPPPKYCLHWLHEGFGRKMRMVIKT